MCICPEGYQQVGMTDECKDIDECSLNSRLCSNGRCINFDGGYRCDCFRGFEPNADGTECIGRLKKRYSFDFKKYAKQDELNVT